MKPFTISITGAYSGAGKTTVGAAIIKGISMRCGAIKYTRTDLYSSLTDEDDAIGQEGKDTERLKSAGAENVQWIRSTAEELEELLGIALDRLSDVELILIEGNGPLKHIRPDLQVFVFGDDPAEVKPGAFPLIESADYILYKRKPSIKPTSKMYNKCSDKEMDEFINDMRNSLKIDQDNGT